MKLHINLVVYFKGGSDKNYPFNVPEYKKSYMDFFSYACSEKNNLKCFIARDNSYQGNGLFTSGQIYDPIKNDLLDYNKEIISDIIYDKGSLITTTQDTGNIINHPRFNLLCKDKVRSALIFPDLFPDSVKVQSETDMSEALNLIDTEKIVIKPLTGQEGEDIKIMDRNKAHKLENIDKNNDLVVQEFIETKDGIKNLTEKRHDLRVLIMNGEIVQAYIRNPKEGNLIANVSQGGSLQEIEISDLPEDIIEAVKKVDLKFSKYYPRIYSIDFGYTPAGPRIFEFNSQPGLPFPSWGKYYSIWHEKLYATLMSSIK